MLKDYIEFVGRRNLRLLKRKMFGQVSCIYTENSFPSNVKKTTKFEGCKRATKIDFSSQSKYFFLTSCFGGNGLPITRTIWGYFGHLRSLRSTFFVNLGVFFYRETDNLDSRRVDQILTAHSFMQQVAHRAKNVSSDFF